MGSKMVKNLADDNNNLIVYDRSLQSVQAVIKANPNHVKDGSIATIGEKCDIVFTMLPNDAVVEDVSNHLLAGNKGHSGPKKIHVSCSTISPELAKKLTTKHSEHGFDFISSPVFARPDGITRREAIFMLSGNKESKEIAMKYLSLLGKIEDFGEETGAANVVKLCGNFLIAVRVSFDHFLSFLILKLFLFCRQVSKQLPSQWHWLRKTTSTATKS